MAQVAVLGGASCKVRSLPNGVAGDVLTMLPSGEPGWAANSGGDGVDLCALNAAQIACLATAVRGELVQDVFGVELGYLLSL